MHRSVHTVSPALSLAELERALVEREVSGFPVVDGDLVVGVVTRADIVRKLYLEHESAERTSDYFCDASGFHEIPLSTREQKADRVGEQMDQLTVGDIMHRQLHAVSPDQSLRVVAQTMADSKIHRILVIHEGRLHGVVSALDIVRLYADGRIRPFWG